MSQYDHKIFFDGRKTESLLGARGVEFDELIREVLQTPQDSVERAAFVNLIASLSICETCDINQYRASSRGCALCAEDSLKRAEKTDAQLIKKYHQSVKQIQNYLEELNE